MSWKNIVKNDMENYERRMLAREKSMENPSYSSEENQVKLDSHNFMKKVLGPIIGLREDLQNRSNVLSNNDEENSAKELADVVNELNKIEQEILDVLEDR